MHGETDPRVTGFVEELRAAYGDALAPAPSPSLATLFAEGMAVAPEPRRREVKQGLKSLTGKIAAGLVGLVIGYTGLGAAGALPASLSLASDDDQQVEHVVTGDTQENADVEQVEGVEQQDAGEAAEVEGAEEQAKPVAPVDPATVPVPTSVSEAAHTHAFDEACGNHGAYVSHFARFGTEPDCATTARGAAAGGESGQTVQSAGDDSTTPGGHGKPAKAHAKSAKPKKPKHH